MGEEEFSKRLQIAANNVGWDADIRCYDPKNPSNISLNYDFVINLYGGVPYISGIKNYLVIFHPDTYLFNENGYFKDHLLNYDGYLITLQDIAQIKMQFKRLGRKFNYIPWYPSVYRTSFQPKSVRLKMAYLCANWGNRIENGNYNQLFQLLDATHYACCYGNNRNQKLYPNSYKGTIPFDGVSAIKIFADAGVNLVMHSDLHNSLGIPSGRIFEAAAASTVIISDLNSFVLDNFGDSVLYYDQNQDGYTMYNQINAHMNWIRANPAEATKLAKRAHEIFKTKFLLEDQLLNLLNMHEKISGSNLPEG